MKQNNRIGKRTERHGTEIVSQGWGGGSGRVRQGRSGVGGEAEGAGAAANERADEESKEEK